MKSLRIVPAGLAALLVLLAAACGGAKSATTTAAAPTTTAQSPAATKQQIKQVWQRFFSGKTSASQKTALLQHGSAFAAAIQAETKSPLAKRSSATVSSVTLQGPRKAKVVYTIDLAGKPALQHQTGTAVRVNGSWQVGDKSFCSLLGLQGSAPPACKRAS